MEIAKIEVYYVLEYPDGKYVAIDEQAGGYPYPTVTVRLASKWENERSAKLFQNCFKREGLKLKTVIATIGDYNER